MNTGAEMLLPPLSEFGVLGHEDATLEAWTSVITSKAAIRDRVKTGHTRSDRDQFI
jgi:hypothetical protein